MNRSGHYGAALLLYAPLAARWVAVDERLAVAGGIAALAVARLPDVDARVPLVAHRGVTHTPAFVATVAAGLAAGTYLLAAVAGCRPDRWAACVGVAATASLASHVLADATTPAGVPLLWPCSARRVSADLVWAGDPLVNGALLASGLVAAAMVARGAGWL